MIELSPADQSLISVAAELAVDLGPLAEEMDRQARTPAPVLDRIAQTGLFGLVIPEEYGGQGASPIGNYWSIRALARTNAAAALTVVSHGLAAGSVVLAGSEDQKNRLLPDLASGRTLGALAMTEPEAGSDLAGLKTTAMPHETGPGFRLSGTKRYITNGGLAGLVVVLAADQGGKPPFDKSLYLVRSGAAGFTVGPPQDKLGFRAADTRELYFDRTELGPDDLLGRPGQGLMVVGRVMISSRLAVAALSLGLAETAFELARSYAKERRQFNRRLTDLGVIEARLADMAAEIAAARLLIEEGAWLQGLGKAAPRPPAQAAAMAKRVASDAAWSVASQALQIFGGAGYLTDRPLERLLREARLCQIIEGTNDIQRKIIAKHL